MNQEVYRQRLERIPVAKPRNPESRARVARHTREQLLPESRVLRIVRRNAAEVRKSSERSKARSERHRRIWAAKIEPLQAAVIAAAGLKPKAPDSIKNRAGYWKYRSAVATALKADPTWVAMTARYRRGAELLERLADRRNREEGQWTRTAIENTPQARREARARAIAFGRRLPLRQR